MTRLFLDMGAPVDVEGGWFGSAIRAAAVNGHEVVVRRLLAAGADPHLRGHSPGSPLLVAIDFDRTSIFHLLLESPRINVDNDEGVLGSSLQVAAAQGKLDFARALLERGANVNAEGCVYHTALQAACAKGFREVVNLLLAHGALPDVPDEGPRDVMGLTVEGEMLPKVLRMPFYRSGLFTEDDWENEPLIRFPWNFTDEDLQTLLHTRPQCTLQKGRFGSALRAAIAGGHTDIVRLLQERNARTDVHGGALGSALDINKCFGNEDIGRLLRCWGEGH